MSWPSETTQGTRFSASWQRTVAEAAGRREPRLMQRRIPIVRPSLNEIGGRLQPVRVASFSRAAKEIRSVNARWSAFTPFCVFVE